MLDTIKSAPQYHLGWFTPDTINIILLVLLSIFLLVFMALNMSRFFKSFEQFMDNHIFPITCISGGITLIVIMGCFISSIGQQNLNTQQNEHNEVVVKQIRVSTQAQIKTDQQTIDKLNSHLTLLNNQLDGYIADNNQTKIHQLTQQIEPINTKIKALNSDIQSQQDKYQNARAKMSRIKAEQN